MRLIIILLLIFSSAAILGCSTKYKSGHDRVYSKNLQSAFLEDYKTLSLCKCLEYGHNQKLNLREEDVSCAFPDYMYSEINTIDSLARNERSRILADSAARIGRVAEGMEGKRVMEICLDLYKSTELEALAKSRLKALKKQEEQLYKEQ